MPTMSRATTLSSSDQFQNLPKQRATSPTIVDTLEGEYTCPKCLSAHPNATNGIPTVREPIVLERTQSIDSVISLTTEDQSGAYLRLPTEDWEGRVIMRTSRSTSPLFDEQRYDLSKRPEKPPSTTGSLDFTLKDSYESSSMDMTAILIEGSRSIDSRLDTHRIGRKIPGHKTVVVPIKPTPYSRSRTTSRVRRRRNSTAPPARASTYSSVSDHDLGEHTTIRVVRARRSLSGLLTHISPGAVVSSTLESLNCMNAANTFDIKDSVTQRSAASFSSFALSRDVSTVAMRTRRGIEPEGEERSIHVVGAASSPLGRLNCRCITGGLDYEDSLIQRYEQEVKGEGLPPLEVYMQESRRQVVE